jgi:hypothetical protein
MRRKYYLNKKHLPTIPVPHDFIIKKIEADQEFLSFYFEDDITWHSSAEILFPGAKSLIMRFHLTDPDFDTYKWKVSKTKGKGYFPYEFHNLKMPLKRNLEYLGHNIGYQSVIIKLFRMDFIMIDVEADYVVVETIE